MGIKPRQKN